MPAKKKVKQKVQKALKVKKAASVKKETPIRKYRWMLFGALVGAGVSLFFIVS